MDEEEKTLKEVFSDGKKVIKADLPLSTVERLFTIADVDIVKTIQHLSKLSTSATKTVFTKLGMPEEVPDNSTQIEAAKILLEMARVFNVKEPLSSNQQVVVINTVQFDKLEKDKLTEILLSRDRR